MSKETVQFSALIRKAAEVSHWLYCECCGKLTNHTLTVRGDYEYLTCSCGKVREAKVR